METIGVFFRAIETDPRIGPSHICLFVTLLYLWERDGRPRPLMIKRAEVMAAAKIAGQSTYHRIMGDLVASGYVSYEGRYDRRGSRLFF